MMLLKKLLNIFKKSTYIKRDIDTDIKQLDLHKLPSCGLFYKDDFNVVIRKASDESIQYYKDNYIKDDYINNTKLVSYIVRENSTYKLSYSFSDLISCDVLFIFFEIIKLTKGSLLIMICDDKKVEFGSDTFAYFNIPEDLLCNYSCDTKSFNIDNWKYKMPTIGFESALVDFILNTTVSDSDLVASYSYDFMYFVGGKTDASRDEILELIDTFNELPDDHINKLNNIVTSLHGFSLYSIKLNDGISYKATNFELGDIWD